MGLWACGLGRKVRADVAAVGERAKGETGIRGLAGRSFDAIGAGGRPLAGGIRSLLAIVGVARQAEERHEEALADSLCELGAGPGQASHWETKALRS